MNTHNHLFKILVKKKYQPNIKMFIIFNKYTQCIYLLQQINKTIKDIKYI